jgi:3-deoxy-D-manno-octulosonate 8-phosphate phosphatase (KDO 8-P phosphatase)
LSSLLPAAELARRLQAVRLLAFDFDGVFTDNTVYVSENGSETVRCWRGDGLGLARLRQLGLHLVIISTEVNPVVTARSRKLNIRCAQGVPDKRAALVLLLEELNLTPDEAAFVGNDVNDLACLTEVGLPIVVQDAHPDVVGVAAYQTRAGGGRGAVREVCDLLAAALDSRPT